MQKEQQKSKKMREQKLERERTPLGTAVDVNREKKLKGVNRPST